MGLGDLEPKVLWRYFEALCQIARPSFHEEKVRAFVLEEAFRLNLFAEMDAVGNILVRKKGNREGAKKLILQAHLDMVAEKDNGVIHDFKNDAIKAFVDGDWVRARGTTLGADNGIGVAAMLAVMASRDIAHGDLEFLFTATEETGMLGAQGLQAGWLSGDFLLNLDSELLGEICVGCAGGVDVNIVYPLIWQDISAGKAVRIDFSGLHGGHSGIDIHHGYGNANLLLAHFLSDFSDVLALADFSGGNLRNAIAREAYMVCVLRVPYDVFVQRASKALIDLRASLHPSDQGFSFTFTSCDLPKRVLSVEGQKALLSALFALPDGVLAMNADYPEVVHLSNNLARMSIEEGRFCVRALLRALSDEARNHLAEEIQRDVLARGGEVVFSSPYPAWQPQKESVLLEEMALVMEEVLKRPAKISVIHAGLECGLLGQHYPHWQMLSFGPTIEKPHSPSERVCISSVALFWQCLLGALARL